VSVAAEQIVMVLGMEWCRRSMIICGDMWGVGGCTFCEWMCGGADLVCAQSDFLAIWTARRTPIIVWDADDYHGNYYHEMACTAASTHQHQRLLLPLIIAACHRSSSSSSREHGR
jgi:hypothetical protein